MVLGDLSSYSIYALFQRELEEELNVLQEAFVDFQQGKESDVQEPIALMLMSTSAIYGAAKLIDLQEIEDIARLMNAYIKELQENPQKPLDMLSEGLKFLLDLCSCKEEQVSNWRFTHLQELQAYTQRLEKSIADHSLQQAASSANDLSDTYCWELFIKDLFSKAKALQKALFAYEQAKGEEGKDCLERTLLCLEQVEESSRNFPGIANLALNAKKSLQTSYASLDFVFHSLDLFFCFSAQSYEDFEIWIKVHGTPTSYVKALINAEKKGAEEKDSLEIKESLQSSSQKTLSLCAKNLCDLMDLQAQEALPAATALYRQALSKTVSFLDAFLETCVRRYASKGLNISVHGHDLGIEKSVFDRLKIFVETILDAYIEESQSDCQISFTIDQSFLCVEFKGLCLDAASIAKKAALPDKICFTQLFEDKFFSHTEFSYLRALQSFYHAAKRERAKLEILDDQSVELKFSASLFALNAFLARAGQKIYAFRYQEVQRVESFDPALLQKKDGQFFYAKSTLALEILSPNFEQADLNTSLMLVWLHKRAYLFDEVIGQEALYFLEQKASEDAFIELPSLYQLARQQRAEMVDSLAKVGREESNIYLFDQASLL